MNGETNCGPATKWDTPGKKKEWVLAHENMDGFQRHDDEFEKPLKKRKPTSWFHLQKTLENAMTTQ